MKQAVNKVRKNEAIEYSLEADAMVFMWIIMTKNSAHSPTRLSESVMHPPSNNEKVLGYYSELPERRVIR